jgi:hypothetical protein
MDSGSLYSETTPVIRYHSSMGFSSGRLRVFLTVFAFAALLQSSRAQAAQKSAAKAHAAGPALDPGSVRNGIYQNRSLELTYKIPDGWVLRTDEMNARDENSPAPSDPPSSPATQKSATGSPPATSRVLLAAFSRPPEARAEEVNASVIIAAESVAVYPGLKEAVQYFGPLTEVARARGFYPDEDPYEMDISPKTLIRADFHKNLGSRVMRQSTLALLARGYAVSITVIGGTDEEVEDLINGLSFAPAAKK